MNIYQNYTSREHDRRHLSKTQPLTSPFKLRPLLGQFDIFGAHDLITKQLSHWKTIFPNAAFFAGEDHFFGPVITMVYKNEATSKLSSVSITKFGSNVFENLMLDSGSRFWPACDNLKPEHKDSNVRKALAITNLKNYNKLWRNKGQVPVTLHWDETNAGSLASKMEVLVGRTPEEIGEQLLLLGLLQDHSISSTVVDVVYNNKTPLNTSKTVEDNNTIVTLLGEQVNHLFDPLLEYSHQTLDYEYMPPQDPTLPMLHNNKIVTAILKELLDVQTHFTMDLVCILQDFIIPLRADALSTSPTSTLGISKVNLVFPPTIDEITRVNCITHDALSRAQQYGYMEVFKVLSVMLPYFYNAFVRHQANLSKFHSHYSKFVHHNHDHVFESKEINKGNYTVRGIETVISGSIFELPRMKLIIKRLYENIGKERALDESLVGLKDTETEPLTKYYEVLMEIIDSFGYNETEVPKSKQRVFTPSGKLLTELATGWPIELQYGWMDRKVVGIYQLTNVLNQYSEHPVNEVLIIFSDHLLFIEIVEKSNHKSALLLPEVLMNSLINAKPLPKFSHFPDLRVKYWCDIDNLAVRSYEADDHHYLNFTTYGTNNFRDKDGFKSLNVQNYQLSSGADGLSKSQKVMDLISKAQVLSKSVPFHLFKNSDTHLGTYFCAHDQEDYESEESRSPIVILLNMDMEAVKKIFTFSKSAYFVYNVILLNAHTLQLTGYTRHNIDHSEVDEIVSIDDFNGTLIESLYQSFEAMFRSSYLSPVLTASNLFFINYIIAGHDEEEVEQLEEPKTEGLSRSSDFGNEIGIDRYPETTIPNTEKLTAEVKPSIERRSIEDNLRNIPKRRKSLLHVLFRKMKKNHRSEEPIVSTGVKSKNSAQKNIPDTMIPRGRKLVYKKLYTPAPELREVSAVSTDIESPASTNLSPVPIQWDNTENATIGEDNVITQVAGKESGIQTENEMPIPVIPSSLESNKGLQARNVSTNTNASSKYTEKSLDVQSNFAFPARGPGLSKDHQESTAQPNRNSDIPRMFPVLKATNELEIDSGMLSEAEMKLQTESGWEKFTHGIPPLEATSVKRMSSVNSSATVRHQEPLAETQKWKPATGTLKINENSEPEPNTQKQRVISSQDIAMALENINASGILPEVYEKYKQYEVVPVSTFYNDGEKNWVAYIRDNSSNLQEEIKAMKEEANMDTVDVIDIGTHLSMVPQAQQFDSSDATFSSMEYGTFVQQEEPSSSYYSVVKTSIPDYMVSLPKHDSLQSFNSEFLNSFGKRLEEDFHLLSNGPSREPTFSNDDFEIVRSQINISSEGQADISERSVPIIEEGLNLKGSTSDKGKQQLNMSLGTPNLSSDDEYFSSSEFSTALEFFNQKPVDTEDHATLTSSSSDRTLMNDKLNTKGDNFALRLDSVAYLSDFLNGTVKF